MDQAVGVIGAGGWGTALAKLLCEKGHEVTLWCHGERTYREIQQTQENRSYLPGIPLPPALKISRSLKEAAGNKSILFCAVPSHAVREVMRSARAYIAADSILVCGTKGIDDEQHIPMGEVLNEIFGPASGRRLAFLSGPTFALEVARGLPAAITVAAENEAVSRDVQEILSTQSLRIYT